MVLLAALPHRLADVCVALMLEGAMTIEFGSRLQVIVVAASILVGTVRGVQTTADSGDGQVVVVGEQSDCTNDSACDCAVFPLIPLFGPMAAIVSRLRVRDHRGGCKDGHGAKCDEGRCDLFEVHVLFPGKKTWKQHGMFSQSAD